MMLPNPNGQFGQTAYDDFAELFWALPPHLGDPTHPVSLRRCWAKGRAGVTAVLPILGMLVHRKQRAAGFAKSKEEIARLCGIAATTIDVTAIEELGLARVGKSKTRRSEWPLASWSDIHHQLAAPRTADHNRLRDYFCFLASLLYGGHWAMLSPPQQVVYMALATVCQTYPLPPDLLHWLPTELRREGDLHKCFHGGPRPNEIRLARASVATLVGMTGLSDRAVKDAIVGFKPPHLWPGFKAADPRVLRYQPLRAYPAHQGQELIYCFRDHVEPWPWEVLNAANGDVRRAAELLPPQDAEPEDVDDGAPF